jgi:hypothetical protein
MLDICARFSIFLFLRPFFAFARSDSRRGRAMHQASRDSVSSEAPRWVMCAQGTATWRRCLSRRLRAQVFARLAAKSVDAGSISARRFARPTSPPLAVLRVDHAGAQMDGFFFSIRRIGRHPSQNMTITDASFLCTGRHAQSTSALAWAPATEQNVCVLLLWSWSGADSQKNREHVRRNEELRGNEKPFEPLSPVRSNGISCPEATTKCKGTAVAMLHRSARTSVGLARGCCLGAPFRKDRGD